MKAIEITQTGGPEVMQMRDLAIPKPQHGEVLIQIAASGINFVDLFVREGRFGNQTPFTPGQEAAGTVAAVGSGVSDLKQGDRVAWCSVLGTYAEFAVAPAERVVPIPDDVTFEQAAAVLLQGMTAHYLSRSAYTIQPGDEVLIHAGAGGTGLLLTQMAKASGGRVLTTAGVAELPVDVKARLLLAVQSFGNFTKDNDPHGEHDFGSIELAGETYFWKIDYYDLECRYGSESPGDPSKTTRVLTIMRADEY